MRCASCDNEITEDNRYDDTETGLYYCSLICLNQIVVRKNKPNTPDKGDTPDEPDKDCGCSCTKLYKKNNDCND